MLDEFRLMTAPLLRRPLHGEGVAATSYYWHVVVALTVFRLILASDIGVPNIYGPHDDFLYVLRAYHLFTDGTLGPYDARTLVKLPGFSFILAAVRTIGIPYLLFVMLLQCGAALYFLSALRRQMVPDRVLILSYALVLFAPITFDYQYARVMREPTAISLLFILLGAMAHILSRYQDGRLWPHVGAMVACFAVLPLVREEDVLVYFVLLAFVVVLLIRPPTRGSLKLAALLVVVTVAMAFGASQAMRHFVAERYGAPILHDFGEGEFPRLIAALRSIDSQKDNRHVMVTQEALAKVRAIVPDFVPVIDRLPRPGPQSYSCQRFGVCSEWTNGWMFFWIKDAAQAAGATPNLVTAQAYFRRVREEIEQACAAGRLTCHLRGQGMFPPFELRWTRALAGEVRRAVLMAWSPPANNPSYPQNDPVDGETARIYKVVTMTSYDAPPPLLAGAEPRTDAAGAVAPYLSPLRLLRGTIIEHGSLVGSMVLLAGMASFLFLLASPTRQPSNPLVPIATIATCYAAVKVLALSYISIYMGTLDPRMYFPSYFVGLLLALPLMDQAIGRLRAGRAPSIG